MSAVVMVKRVEACTKQSPHGCIADDGTVRVKTECRLGVIRLVIGSMRVKIAKSVEGSCGVLWICQRGRSIRGLSLPVKVKGNEVKENSR